MPANEVKKSGNETSMKRRPMRRRKKVCVFCGCLLYTSDAADEL